MADTSHPEDRFSRIEQIYHQALEQPEEERLAFLAQACAGDDDLRREVEKLLSFDRKAGSLLESPALEVAAKALARKAERGKRVDFIGQTILHYKVLEKIGEGGMGVVYKALDTHLQRPVAIKVLPAEIVADRERRRRFVQEARAASALNHPNIITIHDISQSEGTDFIAMEYVTGKTLAELIPRKGMKLTDALKYSIQIADALAAAHAAGIVHRDLKPANVMITEKGLVKVLDFGLAKLTESAEKGEPGTTEALEPRTEEGTILGTVSYMSPEQAEGKKIDARSDIFSLGSVLYEMVTGHRAFEGESRILTLSAILHQEPKPVSTITPVVPAELERLINRCLRKDPQRRWQTMADVKVVLEELKEDSGLGKFAAVPPERRRGRSYLWASIILLTGAVLAVSTWLWLGRSRPAAEEGTLTAVPLTTYPGTETYPSFSPDGTQVAFQWCPEGWAPGRNCDIYVKQIGLEPPSRLTNTPEQELCPAWSPDGMFIAFLRQLSYEKVALIRIPQRGGLEHVIAELNLHIPSYFGLYGPSLAWTPDSKWIVVPEVETGREPWSLYLISVQTGEKRRLAHASKGDESGDTNPALSPDGRILAFARMPRFSFTGLWLLRVGEDYGPQGEPQKVASANPNNFGPTWTPDGREIVFSSGDSLWRVAALEPDRPRRLPLACENASTPAISRQGNRLAYSVERADTNIWRIDMPGPDRKPGVPFKFIYSTRGDGEPAFSPDGKKIAFVSKRSGTWSIWICDSDGSNPMQVNTDARRMKWSPDGQSIAFDMQVAGYYDIYVISAHGGVPRRLTTDPAEDNYASWSPDGQSIYFKSLRTGAAQIWKVSAGGGDAAQITQRAEGGLDLALDQPVVSPDGKYFFYSIGFPGPQSVWRLPIEGGETTKLFDGVGMQALWIVGRDGIYFFAKPDEKGHSDLAFYELATSKIRKIATIERPIGAGGIAPSPDGRTILYTQIDEFGSDLMLVENFR